MQRAARLVFQASSSRCKSGHGCQFHEGRVAQSAEAQRRERCQCWFDSSRDYHFRARSFGSEATPKAFGVEEGATPYGLISTFRRICHSQPPGIAARGSAYRLPAALNGNRRKQPRIGFESRKPICGDLPRARANRDTAQRNRHSPRGPLSSDGGRRGSTIFFHQPTRKDTST